MFRNLTTVLSATALSLAIGCSKGEFKDSSPTGSKSETEAEFKELSPTGSGFKVLMPGTPKEMTPVTATGIQMKTYVARDKDGRYIVTYADMPIPDNESSAQVQSRLDDCRDGQVGSYPGGQLASESQIKLSGKYPGRDIRVVEPSKQRYTRSHFFIVNKRLYEIIAIGAQSWVDSAETNAFLDSFALVAR